MRGYDADKIAEYQKHFNTILNLQLITESENLEKSAEDFDTWISTRDSNFKNRNLIPAMSTYQLDKFLEFIAERKLILENKLKSLTV